MSAPYGILAVGDLDGYRLRLTFDPELGTVTWPNGADLAPDVLHEELIPVARSHG